MELYTTQVKKNVTKRMKSTINIVDMLQRKEETFGKIYKPCNRVCRVLDSKIYKRDKINPKLYTN